MKNKLLQFFSDFRFVTILYLVVAVITAISKYNRGPQAYNNYLVFKNVFYHTIGKQNLYGYYPDLYFDSNYYGVFFSILIAPFALLPDFVGMPLWNVANVIVFLYAINKLPFSNKTKAFFGWLCLQEYITAALYFQFNIALTGLLILSAVYVYQKKETQSVISILIGTFVKIYGIVGLSSFLFVKNKLKFILSFVVFAIVFLLLPMLLSDMHFGLQSYADWFHALQGKNDSNQVLGNRQDYSLMGVVRRVLGRADISNIVFLVPGAILFMSPYVRFKQYAYRSFQLMILASTLLFVVLFSSGSESPTYIIAVSGVMIWFFTQKKRTKLSVFLLIFVIILTSFSFSDLFPKWVKEEYIIKYALKAVPCIIVWFKVMQELLTEDFSEREQQLESN